MIKTYILNMEKDVQKRATIESQLNKQKNLDINFFKAIEGNKLTEKELFTQVDMQSMKKRYNNFATLPAIGCALSHWNIYNQITLQKDKYALIFEDDALLSEDLSDKIKKVESFLLTDNPVAILFTPEFVYSKRNKISTLNHLNIYRLNGGTMCTGYIVNQAAAKLLKEKLFPIRYLADHWDEFSKFGIEILGVVPHLVSYPNGLGEIGTSQHSSYKKNIGQKIRHYLAGIKGKIYVFLFIYMKGFRISTKNW